MESNFELQRLSAFLDGALEPSQHLEAQADLNSNARLRSELHALMRIRDRVQVHATRYPLPERLAYRVRCAVVNGRDDDVSKRIPQHVPPAERRRFRLAVAVATIAIAGLAISQLKVLVPASAGDDQLMEAAVASHLRASTGDRLVDLASADPAAVATWLSSRLSFSTPELNWGNATAKLMGGRIDSLEGRSTAAMVYRVDDHVIDVFVLPVSTDEDAINTVSLRGYTVSHWSQGGLRYCVVSDLSRRPLTAILKSLRRPVGSS